MADGTQNNIIFVDTSAFVAINVKTDSLHERARQSVEAHSNSKITFVTTPYIIAETVTVISQRFAHAQAVLFYESVHRDIMIIRISEEIEQKAFAIFKRLTTKNISFVDCISFAFMRSYGITSAFAFDQDFKKQGFKLFI